jgi:hypothetical protein
MFRPLGPQALPWALPSNQQPVANWTGPKNQVNLQVVSFRLQFFAEPEGHSAKKSLQSVMIILLHTLHLREHAASLTNVSA